MALGMLYLDADSARHFIQNMKPKMKSDRGIILIQDVKDYQSAFSKLKDGDANGALVAPSHDVLLIKTAPAVTKVVGAVWNNPLKRRTVFSQTRLWHMVNFPDLAIVGNELSGFDAKEWNKSF